MRSVALKYVCLALMLCLCVATSIVAARHVPIVIIHTTDLHGHVLSARDYDGNENIGGLLRCATLIKEWREKYPNVLLVDIGDLYQGAIESYLSRGLIMNRALEWLGYDAWVVGNHEFDWGLRTLSTAINDSSVPVLGANIGVRPGASNPLSRVQPYVIRQVDGVRIALVGLTTDAIPTWSRPHLLGDVIIEDSVTALRSIMPAVRAERPDIMILLAHQGYRPFGDSPANQINRIARHFPEFDVILGGHSHQPVDQSYVNGILYSQAGYFGIWLGKVRLVYDTVAREIIEESGQVQHVSEEIAKDPALKEVLDADLTRARALANQQVGELAHSLSARSSTPGQSGVQQLICRAIAAATGVDVVLHGRLANETLAAGPVYRHDVWRIVPYENTIGVLQLTAGELQTILEENVAQIQRSQFMGVHGIKYELHEAAEPGSQIRNLRLADGSAIHPRRRIGVALNSYVLASGGSRFLAARRLADDPLTRLEMTDVDTRSAVITYLQRNRPLAVDDNASAMQRVRASN